MGRHGGAGGATVFLFNNFTEAIESKFPLPYFEQGADDGAYHVAQEAVGFDTKHEQVVLFKPISLHYFAVASLNLGVKL